MRPFFCYRPSKAQGLESRAHGVSSIKGWPATEVAPKITHICKRLDEDKGVLLESEWGLATSECKRISTPRGARLLPLYRWQKISGHLGICRAKFRKFRASFTPESDAPKL